MSDDLKRKGPQDARRVNVHEIWEAEYWCKKFGCTKNQLVAAVGKVGVSAEAVEEELKRQ